MDMKDFRQPMVTSLGVILGFLVGFLGQWVTESTFSLDSTADEVVFTGSFVGALLLFIALFRMLSPNAPTDNVKCYYSRTFMLYMWGVVVAFGSILVSAFL